MNNDDAIITSLLDNESVNYSYDQLGRLTGKTIGDCSTEYQYVTNGKRTSLLTKSVKNNGDIYSYKYDKLDNITHIYHNGILENRYYYDDYNELVKEDNYILNKMIEYNYDSLGNLLFKKVYELGTDNLVAQDSYQYNNSNWKDQLTQFNNDIITYDAIGNPLTIGENITLDWINGRQLNQYMDSNNTVKYQYNKDGIRTSKTINNVKTEYYLEGTSIIFEKTGSNVLYYIRNAVDELANIKIAIFTKESNTSYTITLNNDERIYIDTANHSNAYENCITLMEKLNITYLSKEYNNVEFMINSVFGLGQAIVLISDIEKYKYTHIVTKIQNIYNDWYYVETK